MFEQASRGENMILTLTNSNQSTLNTRDIAMEYLGREIWVSWPHMTEAKVVEVTDGKFSYSMSHDGKITSYEQSDDDAKTFACNVIAVTER